MSSLKIRTNLRRWRTPTPGLAIPAAETAITWGGGKAPPSDISLDDNVLQTVMLRVEVAGAVNLNSLNIYGLLHPQDTVYVPLANAAAHYVPGNNRFVRHSEVWTVAAPPVFVDHDCFTINANQFGWLILAVNSIARLRITASTAAGVATVHAFLTGIDTGPAFAADPEIHGPIAALGNGAIAAGGDFVNVNGATDVLAANPDRQFAILTNNSISDIHVCFDTAAGTAATVNMPMIRANGGVLCLYRQGLDYRGPINAIHGAGAVNRVLGVIEG